MQAIFSSFYGILIDGTDFIDFLCEVFRMFRLFGGMQPITDEMGADFPHIKKMAYDFR